MPRWSVAFVRIVDRMNYGVGRFAMYLLFVLMGILMWSTISKVAFTPSYWTLEMAQFAMVAYYILGGPYSMQLASHVRMDLAYAKWSARKRAWVDAFTIFALIVYLGVMLWGALDSLGYSLGLTWEGGVPQIGRLERSPTAWRPYMWPIKSILCVGFLLMLLQSIAYFIRDIATLRGAPIPGGDI
ncbi:TRAP-type mannitol/chloroaromatic compound transport system, small permease component [Gemmobacter aquatilis]|uniref:TRAP transporter small permease protein n=1 Tax=Gemmobacter aquatilis TaxID=933059 RepID=A0A1H8ITX1_9RHOB|nr:TRAP transporter small permease subunit [Gemmobacter aquatilis]SEN71902.1 TRAP-type mannitol/chloroaromatic compound transport system, small permease component [Gemmobacter aquatilis]